MNLSGQKSRLVGLTKEIQLRWSDTTPHWRDAKGQEFGRHYMQELQLQVDKTVTIIEKLDEVLKRIQNDCE
ncbi:MAG: hypothetical protein U1F65_00440 [Verrucomicrobiota bacterium]